MFSQRVSVTDKPYFLPGFPERLSSDQIQMGPMTDQAISNGLLLLEKNSRFILMVFRSKKNPSEIYYELIPSSEDGSTSNQLSVVNSNNVTFSYGVTYAATQRGTGVVHRAALELMKQFYGEDIVPTLDINNLFSEEEIEKELALLAGSVELMADGRIKLITRSNFCNAKTCLYPDEVLLLAMRHCFLPAEISDDAIKRLVEEMSQEKKLDQNGAFSLFMTDLLCQLPLEISTVIYDAIKRDTSATAEYKPELNEDNVKAIQFRDEIYPQLLKNKEKLLHYLMIQLVLSSARAEPDRYANDESKREAHNRRRVEVHNDCYHSQPFYLSRSRRNPDWSYPAIERYLITMTQLATQLAVETSESKNHYQFTKDKMRELLNQTFPCGPLDQKNQTILENAIYRHDLTAIEQLIKFGAVLTKEQMDNNRELSNYPALKTFIQGALDREVKKNELIKEICEKIKIDKSDPAWSTIALFVDNACNTEKSRSMGYNISFAAAMSDTAAFENRREYCLASPMELKYNSADKWILASAIYHVKKQDFKALSTFFQNASLVQFLKENINTTPGLYRLNEINLPTLLNALKKENFLLAIADKENKSLFLDILPDEIRNILLTPTFTDMLLTHALKENSDQLQIIISKLAQYTKRGPVEIEINWLLQQKYFDPSSLESYKNYSDAVSALETTISKMPDKDRYNDSLDQINKIKEELFFKLAMTAIKENTLEKLQENHPIMFKKMIANANQTYNLLLCEAARIDAYTAYNFLVDNGAIMRADLKLPDKKYPDGYIKALKMFEIQSLFAEEKPLMTAILCKKNTLNKIFDLIKELQEKMNSFTQKLSQMTFRLHAPEKARTKNEILIEIAKKISALLENFPYPVKTKPTVFSPEAMLILSSTTTEKSGLEKDLISLFDKCIDQHLIYQISPSSFETTCNPQYIKPDKNEQLKALEAKEIPEEKAQEPLLIRLPGGR